MKNQMRIFTGVKDGGSIFVAPVNELGEQICTGDSGEAFEIEMWSPISARMMDFQIDAQDQQDIMSLKVRQRLRTQQLDEDELRSKFIDELLEYSVETKTDEIRHAIKGWKNFPRCMDPDTGKPMPDDQQPDTTFRPEAVDALIDDNPFIARQLKSKYTQEKNSLTRSKQKSQANSSDMQSDNAGSTSQNQTDKETSSPGDSTSKPPIH